MAQGFGKYRTGALDGSLPSPKLIPGNVNDAPMRIFTEVFDLSLAAVKKTSGDNNVLFKVPKGFVPASLRVSSSVSLTTSQLSFGISGTTNKYGAAAAYGTTADVVKEYLPTSKRGIEVTADETWLMTIGTADLPGTGTVVVELIGATKG